MEFHEYVEKSSRTAPVNRTQQERVLNAALGLAGETFELMADLEHSSAIAYEAGDVCWYLAELIRALDIPIPERQTIDDFFILTGVADDVPRLVRLLYINVGQITEQVKKGYFHGRGVDRLILSALVVDVLRWLEIILFYTGYNLEMVLDKNYDKLLARWPGGFKEGEKVLL